MGGYWSKSMLIRVKCNQGFKKPLIACDWARIRADRKVHLLGFSALCWKPLILHYSDQISLWMDQMAKSERTKGIKKINNWMIEFMALIFFPHLLQDLQPFPILHLKPHHAHDSRIQVGGCSLSKQIPYTMWWIRNVLTHAFLPLTQLCVRFIWGL